MIALTCVDVRAAADDTKGKEKATKVRRRSAFFLAMFAD